MQLIFCCQLMVCPNLFTEFILTYGCWNECAGVRGSVKCCDPGCRYLHLCMHLNLSVGTLLYFQWGHWQVVWSWNWTLLLIAISSNDLLISFSAGKWTNSTVPYKLNYILYVFALCRHSVPGNYLLSIFGLHVCAVSMSHFATTSNGIDI